ncbi:hypothetical protein PIB30_027876 [Stylosanthes scabra]|uniref:Uncharacterized protein n=1 Tax=Stylosanthes scabra TaxID=79078 RepID=A0ABU6WB21_9FABA|nr:hypothetical protein [Stylosanthes scabra]
MALLVSAQSNFKNGFKKYQEIVEAQEAEYEEIVEAEAEYDDSASKTDAAAAESMMEVKKGCKLKVKTIQESQKYLDWVQDDCALMTWLDASLTLTYKNKVVIRNHVDSLHSLSHTFIDSDHVQAILHGLQDEFEGYVTYVLSRLTTWTINEAESFLKAYESRLNKNAQTLAVAHIAQAHPDSLKLIQIQLHNLEELGHTVHTCYHMYDLHFQGQTSQSTNNIPYSNTLPPPPATSFHQPKTYITTAPNQTDFSWFVDSGTTHHVTASIPTFSNTMTLTKDQSSFTLVMAREYLFEILVLLYF